MNQVEHKDLVDIIEYEKTRDNFRKNMINYKKSRRIKIGPYVTVVFENKKTMIYQIQEIMRAERLVHDNEIKNEIDVYNSILNKKLGLSATLFIEVTEELKIKEVLNKFIGITLGGYFYLSFNGKKVFADFESGREEADKISSVHYVKFNFSEDLKNEFINSKDISLIINYGDYNYTQRLDESVSSSLLEDFD